MRAADRQREWWDQAVTEVRARLARIERGESWAPAQVVRCLRVFVGLRAVELTSSGCSPAAENLQVKPRSGRAMLADSTRAVIPGA